MIHRDYQSTDEPDTSLGALLRNCRKEANLSMQTVADKAGLSVGFISQIERNITIPSLTSLKSIASVLGQRVSYFLEEPFSNNEVTRNNERLNVQLAGRGVTYEKLSAKFEGRKIRSVISCFPANHRPQLMIHEGEELLFILEGELTVEIEGKSSVLKSGDSIHFDARKSHRYWNHTSNTTVFLWCGTMDIFDEDQT